MDSTTTFESSTYLVCEMSFRLNPIFREIELRRVSSVSLILGFIHFLLGFKKPNFIS